MRPNDSGASSPDPLLRETSRNLTPQQLEAVVRRVEELQAGYASSRGDDVSKVEMLRIGQELGLDPAAVRCAMGKVRSRPDEGNALLQAVGVHFPRRRPESSATSGGPSRWCPSDCRNPEEASSSSYQPRNSGLSLQNWKTRLSMNEIDYIDISTSE